MFSISPIKTNPFQCLSRIAAADPLTGPVALDQNGRFCCRTPVQCFRISSARRRGWSRSPWATAAGMCAPGCSPSTRCKWSLAIVAWIWVGRICGCRRRGTSGRLGCMRGGGQQIWVVKSNLKLYYQHVFLPCVEESPYIKHKALFKQIYDSHFCIK